MLLLLVIIIFSIVSFFIPYPQVINLQARVHPEGSGRFSLIVPGSGIKAQDKIKVVSILNQRPADPGLLYPIASVSLLSSNPDSSVLKMNGQSFANTYGESMQEAIIEVQVMNYEQRLSGMLWRQLQRIFTLD